MAVAIGVVLLVLWQPQPAPVTIHAPPAALPAAQPAAAPPTAPPAPVTVHVNGAVALPGLYTLPPGARLDDAIKAAGGLAPDADAAALNLAVRLADGSQVHVPAVGEALLPTPTIVPTPVPPAADAGPDAARSLSVPAAGALINVNTATLAELEALPGIGPAKAQAIVDNRPYASVDDLDRVPGIGAATLADLRPYVTAP
jgi:competence protein ComEA